MTRKSYWWVGFGFVYLSYENNAVLFCTFRVGVDAVDSVCEPVFFLFAANTADTVLTYDLQPSVAA